MRRYGAPKFLLVRARGRRGRKETTSRNGTLKLPRGSDAKESRDNFLRLDIYARSPSMLPGPSSYLCPSRETPIVTKTFPRSCNMATRINDIYIYILTRVTSSRRISRVHGILINSSSQFLIVLLYPNVESK